MVDIMSQISEMVGGVVIFVPNIIAAIIILLIGWIIGRVLGKAVSVFLDKIGVDDALRKTEPGAAIEKSGLSIVHLFDILVRIFIYLIAIMAATNVLQIASLSKAMAIHRRVHPECRVVLQNRTEHLFQKIRPNSFEQ